MWSHCAVPNKVQVVDDKLYFYLELDPNYDPYSYAYFCALKHIYGEGFDLESLIFRVGIESIFLSLQEEGVIDSEKLMDEIDGDIETLPFYSNLTYYERYGYN